MISQSLTSYSCGESIFDIIWAQNTPRIFTVLIYSESSKNATIMKV